MDLLQKLDEALERAEGRIKEYSERISGKNHISMTKSLNYARSARQKTPGMKKKTILSHQITDSLKPNKQESDDLNISSSANNTTSPSNLSSSSMPTPANQDIEQNKTETDVNGTAKISESPISNPDVSNDTSHANTVSKESFLPVDSSVVDNSINSQTNVPDKDSLQRLLDYKAKLYSSIDNVSIIQNLERLDEQILKTVSKEKLNKETPGQNDASEAKNNKACDIIEKYLEVEDLSDEKSEVKTKLTSLTRNSGFINEMLNLFSTVNSDDRHGGFSGEMLEKVLLVLNKGDIQTDKRFIDVLDKTISTLSKSKDPFTCRVTVNIAICRKYVEDFIELKGIVEEFIRLRF